uniref:Transcription factor bHLH7 n=1 Tax=Nothapodytes nimmoniana TaxID=159386 RepID=A0A9E8Z0E3_NOTNI|nr:transcription factor bHLH7 [Nothapodytes nimmoniana]
MEISHIRSLAEVGMEDTDFIHQWPLNSFDEISTLSAATAALGENLHQFPFSHSIFDLKPSPEISQAIVDRPMKQMKMNSWDACRANHISNPQATSPILVPFSSSGYFKQPGILMPKEETLSCNSKTILPSDFLVSEDSSLNQNYLFKACQGAKRVTPAAKFSQAQDHIIAERKRREKLSQRFIALSALIPGLKKMDKASVLGDAIKYLKQLQERVKTLEEQTKKKSVESVVFVKKFEFHANGESSSSNQDFSNDPVYEPLPEVEARISDKDVLVRIHCERRKGVLEKVVSEIEKFHLSVINSCALSFGGSALDITIIAQMDMEFNMTVKDLVKNLHSALKLFM